MKIYSNKQPLLDSAKTQLPELDLPWLQPVALYANVDRRIVEFFRDTLRIRRGVKQNIEGNYVGKCPQKITDARLFEHLAGHETYAFSTGLNGFSEFIAFDVDAHWPELLPIVRQVLTKHELDKATFLTTGSDPGRGKVVVVFGKAATQRRAGNFVFGLWNEILEAGASKLTIRPREVDLYPLRQGARLLRIGGRHRTRSLFCDNLLDFDGSPFDPAKLVPARIVLGGGRHPVVLPKRKIHRGVLRLCRNGVEPNWDRKQVMTALTRVAHEVIRVEGQNGIGHFFGLVEQIAANSKQPAAAHVTVKKAKSAWQVACDAQERVSLGGCTYVHPGFLESNDTFSRLSNGTKRLVRSIGTLARELGLFNLRVLALSQRQIAQAYGASQQATGRALKRAEAAGTVVFHDPGTQGDRGDKAIIGLVLNGETPASILEYGRTHPIVKARLSKRAAYAVKKKAAT